MCPALLNFILKIITGEKNVFAGKTKPTNNNNNTKLKSVNKKTKETLNDQLL